MLMSMFLWDGSLHLSDSSLLLGQEFFLSLASAHGEGWWWFGRAHAVAGRVTVTQTLEMEEGREGLTRLELGVLANSHFLAFIEY